MNKKKILSYSLLLTVLLLNGGCIQKLLVDGKSSPIVTKNTPIVVEQRNQPRIVERRSQPTVVHRVNQPRIAQNMHQPRIVESRSEPIVVNSVSQPGVVQNVYQPIVVENIQPPTIVNSVSEPTVVNSVSEPTVVNSVSEPTIVNSVSEPTIVNSTSEPTVVNSASEPTIVENISESTINQPENNIVGCSDDITSTKKSNCNLGEISENDLTKSSSNGSEHILQSVRGKTITIIERKNGFIFPQYKNKVVILEIFGKNCPHCHKQIPILKRIRNRHRGRLEIVAIQSQGRMSRREARNYINRNGIRYPIVEGDDTTNLLYFIQTTYGWTGILPYILVVKDGVTEFSYSGEVDYSEIGHDVDSLF